MSAKPRPRLEPATRVQFVPGVGPKRALLFEKLDIHTVEHLLRHYPRSYLDARRFVKVKDLTPGQLVTVSGTIQQAAALRTRAGRSDLSVTLADETGTLACYFFGQPFLARTLKKGTQVVVSGELDPLDRRMHNPMFEVVEGDVEELLHVGRLVPVHALTRGVTARGMRSAVRSALEAAAAVADPVPEWIAAERGLTPLADALRQIHFPDDDEALERARHRLAFEELLLLQSVMALRRRVLKEKGRGLVTSRGDALAGQVRATLPFELTSDQKKALKQIVADMSSETPMQRLLLGDVGSGKTVVGLLAALHAVEAGHQVAFMAPTEILARQHAATLQALCQSADVEIVTLTGATGTVERREIAERLESGDPLIAVGTHALLEDKVKMSNLGLAIVDEQHRFGVKQRASLAKKGVIPDVLVLTATPIPRTLALTYYGDLDVSRLRARPEGRGRLVTRVAGEEKFPKVIEFLAKELKEGRQAFVVLPLIEEGRSEMKAAQAEHERLSQHPLLAAHEVGLLHGRLKASEKQAVMEAFAGGAIHVLVTTTVVEVGVDVPNATMMIVESAERFGLTQLHQLRGRVGRGAHRSVCVLVPGPGAPAQSLERLNVLAQTSDGFEIAEADLRLRGPGELWSTRQSGLPRLRLADLRDEMLLLEARDAAHALVERDPWLTAAEHEPLRAVLLAQYKDPLELALAG